MTILDRILCRLGFHGKLEPPMAVVDVEQGGHTVYNKYISLCTICNRPVKKNL